MDKHNLIPTSKNAKKQLWRSFCWIGIQKYKYSQKYTPPYCFFSNFAGWDETCLWTSMMFSTQKICIVYNQLSWTKYSDTQIGGQLKLPGKWYWIRFLVEFTVYKQKKAIMSKKSQWWPSAFYIFTTIRTDPLFFISWKWYFRFLFISFFYHHHHHHHYKIE